MDSPVDSGGVIIFGDTALKIIIYRVFKFKFRFILFELNYVKALISPRMFQLTRAFEKQNLAFKDTFYVLSINYFE